MTVRDLLNLLEDIENADSEILIETSEGFIEEVELVEPVNNDELLKGTD